MRKIRHVLKLARETELTKRQIARSLSMSATTVGEYLRRAADAKLSWPLPPDWDDCQIEAALFPSTQGPPRYPAPTGLVRHPPGVPAQRRDLAALMGGVQGGIP